MAVIGVDIGGTKISAALFNEDGRMICKQINLIEKRTGYAVGNLVCETISGIIIKYPRTAIDGIGVCIPGITYSENDTVWAPNIPGWDNFPLKSIIQTAIGSSIPIMIESDRTCYILGEVWMGAAKGCSDAIYLAVGTGIGAGILIDGNILHGKRDIAGATGWMALVPPYKEEYIPVGCFEYYASGNGIAERAKQIVKESRSYSGVLGKAAEFTAQDVFEAYKANDPVAVKVIDNAIQLWGMGCANLTSLFNPQKIIFGGGVFGPAAEYIGRIYAEACRWGQPIAMREVEFCHTEVNDNAALFGAAYLVIKSNKHKSDGSK